MGLHRTPICFSCTEQVMIDPVFAAICDHEDCPSAVFHPLCLMRHREDRAAHIEARERFFATHRVRHSVEIEHLHDEEESDG